MDFNEVWRNVRFLLVLLSQNKPKPNFAGLLILNEEHVH